MKLEDGMYIGDSGRNVQTVKQDRNIKPIYHGSAVGTSPSLAHIFIPEIVGTGSINLFTTTRLGNIHARVENAKNKQTE